MSYFASRNPVVNFSLVLLASCRLVSLSVGKSDFVWREKMNNSILVNGSQRSELVIFVSKGKRYGPIMASVPANKENVSPEKDVDCLSDSFQKSLALNHVEKDGRYFLDLMERESERLTRLCQATEQEMANKSLPEDGKLSRDKSYYKRVQ